MTENTTIELDLRQEDSPVPMIKTKETLDQLGSGDVLKVVVTKEPAVQNIKTLITNNTFELLETTKIEGVYTLLIKKP